ncbi:hypothetical protein ACFV29_40190 [Streptomyces sp. NPDC059690]|uniref:hypothetical protein n=1 Tax=Streptomyces sp. NPDC059690 TaxID=3346907 RepID=UPI00368DD854
MHVGSHVYHFGRYVDDAHSKTAQLISDGSSIVFRPALYAAALVGLLTGREWDSRRTSLVLTQSVSPRRSAVHAYRLDVLVHGADRQSAYFTVGPVTLAYVVLGVAAGAFTGTWLRSSWQALVTVPVLTWLLAAVLVRSRAVLLADPWIFSQVHGMHPGGVLGLQFYDLLPQDSYLLNSLTPSDYWGYQIASSALSLALAALLGHGALRILHRRLA